MKPKVLDHGNAQTIRYARKSFTGKYFWVCLLLLLTSACTYKGAIKKIDASKNIPLDQLNHWQLKARMAITTPKESITASLNWQKNNQLFDFHVSGAFGVTYAHLIQLKDKATLEIPDTQILTQDNAQVLLQNTLNWKFPINALAYWVKGLPSGEINEQVFRNDRDQIDQIQLNYWRITFSKYRNFQGYLLPKKIKAVHPQMTIKLVAKSWLFLE